MIRADLTLVPDPLADLGEAVPAPLRRSAGTTRTLAKAPETQAFPPPASVPAWARANGRAGEGDPLFAAGAALALLDAYLRRDPPCAGALRSRLALNSAAASAKILRVNADEGALRELRFAMGDDPGPAARLLRALAMELRQPAAQPSTQAGQGSPPRRGCSTWLYRTRMASRPA